MAITLEILEKFQKSLQDNERRISDLEERVSRLQFLRKKKKKMPSLAEIARKRAAVKEAEDVGDQNEIYYLATKAWLENYCDGQESAYAAEEAVWKTLK
jgi:hypothetical protein